MLRIGRTFGRNDNMVFMLGTVVFGPNGEGYDVLEVVGNGSFGMVYKVREQGGGKIFALKTIATSPLADNTALKAFVNEGNLAVGVRHPNVIEYLYFHDGARYPQLPPYILMEYAEDGTLEKQIETAQRSQKPFSNTDLVAMFKQLVAGMKAINEKLIHRDVKPDNILITRDTLKISDFGLSKVVTDATRNSTFKGFGCLPFMAPEAWRFERNTVQLDIYSMGIVFYMLATLKHPFDLRNADQRQWMEAHFYQAVPSPDTLNRSLGPNLSQTIIRMVEKSTAKRFKKWDEIQNLLESEESKSANPANSIVQVMLQKRLEQDSAAQAAEAQRRREQDEMDQFCKLIISQAERSIVSPLKELITDFNRRYAGRKAYESSNRRSDTGIDYKINFPSQKSISFQFEVLLKHNFMRDIPVSWQRLRPTKGVVMPKFKGRTVQGWGYVRGSDDRGFNIIIVENQGEIYGEIITLEKEPALYNAGFVIPARGAYDLHELEQQLEMVELTNDHRAIRIFEPAYLQEFVVRYV